MGNLLSSPSSVTPTTLVEQIDQNISRPYERPHPQETFSQTVIDVDSFYGKIRALYSERVLKTQLDQLRKQGSYNAFKLGWHPKYEINRVYGGKCGMITPPTLFWDSDVGKWIEAACYFLSSPDGKRSSHAPEFISAIDELIDMMGKAQQPDGYLNIYFTVVDKAGKLKNLRDMHEMYNCGHLLEAALAHHRYTGSRKFLNIMLKYIDLLMKTFGPAKDQRHGYPGHPELELAVLRLYSETKDPRHYTFGKYLVSARGRKEPDLGNRPFFVWEAEQRKDTFYHAAMESLEDGRYHQWHAPLHKQDSILGHSVRALYLVTAAADLDGQLLEDAKRLWTDCVDNKMYPTGGAGSVPDIEGFSEIPHFLPNGTDEGGCYAETCASIALMMVSERLLSHELNAKVRNVMELCLLNNVLGGASLDGSQFYYGNQLATCGDEIAERHDWFDVCCCPPNLTRTMGLLGGYMWSAKASGKVIELNVYLYMSGTRQITLPNGGKATARMVSEMPWNGRTSLQLTAPSDWQWRVTVPHPDYAVHFAIAYDDSVSSLRTDTRGFARLSVPANSELSVSFDMPVRLLSPHPATHQDTLAVARGPVVFTAETYDNASLEERYPHFANIGLPETTTFKAVPVEIKGIPMIALVSSTPVYGLQESARTEIGSMRVVGRPGLKAKQWVEEKEPLRLVPFFARSNRGSPGRIRTMFNRVPSSDIV
ncbi:hypothetical protein CI109_103322 [Kwoniella shandongensis]|uniref:Uncharacterized protein n=1 Tax=Kwoniella shandongensis TaxID=1734106 RepID=A0A5M6BQV8_9TREE|nr:uncharacterized protein CI109_007179 [Kwoniella shandongensis]KAA5524472.1 hypothetical protein CI109_007179 [Kwoniella shandongensis]